MATQIKVLELQSAPTYPQSFRKAVEAGGKLISHRHLDRLAFNETSGVFFARELLVDVRGKPLVRGKDIVTGRVGLVIPGADIEGCKSAENVFGKANIALLVDPASLEKGGDTGRYKRMEIVHPDSIIVITNIVAFKERGMRAGKVDKETRLPLEVSQEEWMRLVLREQRWLSVEEGINPIVRRIDPESVGACLTVTTVGEEMFSGPTRILVEYGPKELQRQVSEILNRPEEEWTEVDRAKIQTLATKPLVFE